MLIFVSFLRQFGREFPPLISPSSASNLWRVRAPATPACRPLRRAVVARAVATLETDLSRTPSDVRRLQGVNQGQLRIAAIDSHANGLVPEFVHTIHRGPRRVAGCGDRQHRRCGSPPAARRSRPAASPSTSRPAVTCTSSSRPTCRLGCVIFAEGYSREHLPCALQTISKHRPALHDRRIEYADGVAQGISDPCACN